MYKHLIILISLIFSSFILYGQINATGNKLRLLWQTTGDGLVYRDETKSSYYTPTSINNAWMLLDTVTGRFYFFDRDSINVNRGGWVDLRANVGKVTGTLPVGNGGTGQSTLTADRLLVGNGSSAITSGSNLRYRNSLSFLEVLNNSSDNPCLDLNKTNSGMAQRIIGGTSNTVWLEMQTGNGTKTNVARYITGVTSSPNLMGKTFILDTTAFFGANSNSVQILCNGDAAMTTVGDVNNNFIGRTGIGLNNPSALLHLRAGVDAPNSAPLKFTSGTNTSTPEAGAMEWDGTNLHMTNSSNVRRWVNQGIAVTSGTINFAATNGGTHDDETVTVTGATAGDVVSLGVPNGAVFDATCYTAWVSADNTVTIRFNNYSGTQRTPSGVFKIFVTKF